jgi:hypothetical protein
MEKAAEGTKTTEFDNYMRKLLGILAQECKAALFLWKQMESGGKLAYTVLSEAIQYDLIRFRYCYSGKKKTRFYYLNLRNDALIDEGSRFYFPEIAQAVITLRAQSKAFYFGQRKKIRNAQKMKDTVGKVNFFENRN